MAMKKQSQSFQERQQQAPSSAASALVDDNGKATAATECSPSNTNTTTRSFKFRNKHHDRGGDTGSSSLLRFSRRGGRRSSKHQQEYAPNKQRSASEQQRQRQEKTTTTTTSLPLSSSLYHSTTSAPPLPHARTAILTSYDPLLQQQQQQLQPQHHHHRYETSACSSTLDKNQDKHDDNTQTASLSVSGDGGGTRTTNGNETIRSSCRKPSSSPSQPSSSWFRFTLCARPSDVLMEGGQDDHDISNYDYSSSSSSSSSFDSTFGQISEDPTVEESFECVFAHQLEEGSLSPRAMLMMSDETEKSLPLAGGGGNHELKSPASLLQSRTPSRQGSLSASRRRQGQRRKDSSLAKASTRPYHAKSLVHMGTYDPLLGKLVPPPPPLAMTSNISDGTSKTTTSSANVAFQQEHNYCPCQRGVVTPLLPPSQWPQRPLMIRPTPGSGMKIVGVRFSSSQEYLWQEGEETIATSAGGDGAAAGSRYDCGSVLWKERLNRYWKSSDNGSNNKGGRKLTSQRYGGTPAATTTSSRYCSECMILPINNGNEPKGEALVVDFESRLFRGTILVRVRGSNGTTQEPYCENNGYFCGMNRKYQIVVRGKFREEALPLTECVVGIQLERPMGNLPPKWIMNGALKVLSFFAPQLKAVSEGDRPHSVSPFGSTPQTLRLDDEAECDESMEEFLHEPIHDHHTLLGKASKHHSSLQRARFRKRNFDKLYVAQSSTPATLPDKVYTFEFLQHLLNMQDWTIELGNMLGHVELKEMMDGQPMQIMARHGNDDARRIWSFDVWHECLIEDSKKYDPVLEE